MKNLIFNATYYGLSILLFLMLLYIIYRGLDLRARLDVAAARHQALGLGLAALGILASLVAGVGLDTLAKGGIISDAFYQQGRFTAFYVGFALVLYGADASASAALGSTRSIRSVRPWAWLRVVLWALFALTVLVSALYLFNPATYTITTSGSGQHVAQQRVYFPVFYSLFVVAVGLPLVAWASKDMAQRRRLLWFAASAALIFLGFLREATIIPSSGNPNIDILVAFVPFAAAGFCLLRSVRSLSVETGS